jgi:CelD/BcsL family acetyltransferase involved in cellulose biosynthesis
VSIHIINPLLDSRWDDLVARHPRASAFHQRGWLEALARTYGHKPLVLTTASAGEALSNGVVLCHVSSWITGTRLVSLPFTDHCEPLLNEISEYEEVSNWLRAECDRQRWKYVELRPLLQAGGASYGLQPSRSCYFHELDLGPSLQQLFRTLHKDCIQRRIRRAEREGLSHEVGRSEELLDEFYRLLLITRRRLQLLPQSRAWFRNLLECMGDKIQIRVVRKDSTPTAAMLTLRHRSSVIYKYGCSDRTFHSLGVMPLLFWRLIEESKASGAEVIDFGRSDLESKGLITFKERFGTTRRLVTYYRYPSTVRGATATSWDLHAVRQFFSILPDVVCCTAGRILYRHIG